MAGGGDSSFTCELNLRRLDRFASREFGRAGVVGRGVEISRMPVGFAAPGAKRVWDSVETILTRSWTVQASRPYLSLGGFGYCWCWRTILRDTVPRSDGSWV